MLLSALIIIFSGGFMNCLDCKYANKVADGIECDRNILVNNNMIFIPQGKIHINCPCHSDIIYQNDYYNFYNGKSIRNICRHCMRYVQDDSSLKMITIKSKGRTILKRICNICYEKYYQK